MMLHAEVKAEFLAERQKPLVIFQVDPAAIVSEALWRQYDKGAICYAIAEIISARLDSGCYHYRNRRGELLTTLGQVVGAIEAGELA